MVKRFLSLMILCSFCMAALVILLPNKAMACSCAERPSMEEQLERKTAVFAGEVISVKKPSFIFSSADLVKAEFKVNQVWKGDLGTEAAVYTALYSESCGYEGFTAGEEYIVFAYGKSDRLETGICEGTKPLSSAQEDLAALGEGIVPAGESSNNLGAAEISSSSYTTAIIIIVAIVLIVLFIRARNQRRQ